MYAKYIKRILDFIVSLTALLLLSPILLILAIIGAIMMRGNPFFVQSRPGRIDVKTGEEKIFKLIKFRTMANITDDEGNLLPDEKRLNKYGAMLRKTSLDELPEIWNIVVGDMSIVGPRPQLVKDMVFMTPEQRRRHHIRPGLTGLAQVNGRNNISWEEKLRFDLEYMKKITFIGDVKILFRTVVKVFKGDDVVREGTVSDLDFGDSLLKDGKITEEDYKRLLEEAKKILAEQEKE